MAFPIIDLPTEATIYQILLREGLCSGTEELF